MAGNGGRIRVLHVDDDREFARVVDEFLQRTDDSLVVETATNPDDALDRLDEDDLDCIVSDHEMPGRDGIGFLEAVRESHPELPFILYTGKSSEAVAGEALAAGATDYIEKGSGTGQYEILINRIHNAVEQYRSRQRKRRLERIRALVNDVHQALIGESSREELERRVCEILAGADPYRLAIVASVDPETATIQPRIGAGTGEASIADFEFSMAEGTAGRRTPWGTAFHEREVAVAENLQDDSPCEPCRSLAAEHGFRANAVVPLVYESELYGLLGVFADRPRSFDETEREVLAELGDDLAHGIQATEVRTELRKSERRFRAVLEDPKMLFGVLDADGTLRHANRTAMQFVDPDREDVIGEPFWETPWWTDDLRQRVKEWVCRAADGEYVELEADLVGRDGETFPIEGEIRPVTDDQGEVASIVASGRDITERKERERQLQQERDRFLTLFENLPNPVVHGELVGDEALIRRANPAFQHVFGIDADDAPGTNLDELTVPEDRRSEAASINEQIAAEGGIRTEIRRETVHGVRDFLLDVVTQERDDGRQVGYSMYTDITDRKRRETQLERQNERLDEFTSVVSHDLRNPLELASTSLALAREDCESEHLDTVEGAHERIGTLIDDLLALAREGKTVEDVTSVDVGTVAENCWLTAIPSGEATLLVETDGTVRADRDRLRQLFENLLANAVEHGSTGNRASGTLNDAVEHGGRPVTVTVGDLEDRSGFYVADDGVGIPEDERERILEPGYTTADDGTGFGLTIVERIVETHDWDLEVTESADGGARFEVSGVETEP